MMMGKTSYVLMVRQMVVIMSMSNANLPQENSNEGIFLSASKWEVSDNEARMGELLFHRCTKICSTQFLYLVLFFSQVGWNHWKSEKQTGSTHFHRGFQCCFKHFCLALWLTQLPFSKFIGLAGIGWGLQQAKRNWEEEGEKVFYMLYLVIELMR